ncbi:MAG: hypothetical protein LBL73_05470 [Synergistaceae bacterium]|jgi:hypothetical protein|nr:hypothetical protein [Synergistaceae bacterium]
MFCETLMVHEREITDKWMRYFTIYEEYLQKFKNQSVVLWLLGSVEYDILRIWRKYLGALSVIVGIGDIHGYKNNEDDQILVRVGDQTNASFLQSLIDEIGLPDVIVDSSSRDSQDASETFNFLYEKVSKNGIYIVEGLRTIESQDENDLKVEGGSSFLNLCKGLIDALNARHYGAEIDFADVTFSMSFYDSAVVFQKVAWSSDSLKPIMLPAVNKRAVEEIIDFGNRVLSRFRLFWKTGSFFRSGKENG